MCSKIRQCLLHSSYLILDRWKKNPLISGRQNIYVGVPHTYTSHYSLAEVTDFRVSVRHLKTLPRHVGLERSSRMNQEFPPHPNSRSLTWIPQEVPTLSGCRAAWPPHISLGLSPRFRRAMATSSYLSKGCRESSPLHCSSGAAPQALACASQLFPMLCPWGALLFPPVTAVGPECFVSKHHHTTCTSS